MTERPRGSLLVRRAGPGEFYLTASAKGETSAGLAARETYDHIGSLLQEINAEIVSERVFVNLSSESEIRAARAAALQAHGRNDQTPATYIQGNPFSGSGLAGVQVFAVGATGNDAEVSTLEWGGRSAGRIVQYPDASYVYLSGIHGLSAPGATSVFRGEQVKSMFQRAAGILESAGISYREVLRTWIYISDILDWYDDFNAARNAQYRELGLISEAGSAYLPASTGIEGSNSLGAACMMDLLAVKRESPDFPSICALSNPRQIEAYQYRSAFSRGMCVQHNGVLRVYVSGCAAIDDQGRSLCPEDFEGQVRQTVLNVENLLRPVGMRLGHICESTVFLKRKTDVRLFRDLAPDLGLDRIPTVCICADICRPELLFELDALAVM